MRQILSSGAAILILACPGSGAEDGREQVERFALEHRLGLAVREGVLDREVVAPLRKRLETVMEEQAIPLSPPDRLWEGIMGRAAARQALVPLLDDARLTELVRLDDARRERLARAAGTLALAWLDSLLLVPDEEQDAWKAQLAGWASVPGFLSALERDRKHFLSRLPELSLPPVDPALLHTESLADLWESILAGRPPETDVSEIILNLNRAHQEFREETRRTFNRLRADLAEGRIGPAEFDERVKELGPALGSHHTEHEIVSWARERLDADLAEGRIGPAEFEERNRELDRARLEQVLIERRRHKFGYNDNKYEESIRKHARAILERYNERLGELDERGSRYMFMALRGTVMHWLEEEWERRDKARSSERLEAARTIRGEEVGIEEVNLDTLVNHRIHRKALREVLSPEDYASWHRERRRRASAVVTARRDFAAAGMESRLLLDGEQRLRVRAIALAFVPGEEKSALELSLEMARELDALALSRWQRVELEKFLREDRSEVPEDR